MSQDELHNVAQADTPSNVEIPNTTNGLILWLLGRFGVAVVFAASTFYVYQDMRSDRAELMRLHVETINVIRDFRDASNEQTREIRALSLRNQSEE
jgi:hypothetical protein